jgi:hypothetical protein
MGRSNRFITGLTIVKASVRTRPANRSVFAPCSKTMPEAIMDTTYKVAVSIM